ncbi:MAG TPA: hypothetical protein VFX96_17205 [Pyrinomonadaceae bacterium]|nr:hypothetical protein [Pyrinomonadaceae bacterium]
MKGRAKRVLVYTVSILVAPLPLMPFVVGTREFALALIVTAAVLAPASFYVLRGEMRVKPRGLLGNKLLASSLITFVFAVALFVGSLIYLFKA